MTARLSREAVARAKHRADGWRGDWVDRNEPGPVALDWADRFLAALPTEECAGCARLEQAENHGAYHRERLEKQRAQLRGLVEAAALVVKLDRDDYSTIADRQDAMGALEAALAAARGGGS